MSQMAVTTSLSTSNLLPPLNSFATWTSIRCYHGLRHATLFRTSNSFATWTSIRYHLDQKVVRSSDGLVVRAATEGSAKSSQSDEKIPSWARPDSDEPPPWAQDPGSGNSPESTFQIPFFVYLLASAVTAIAAIGSAFEYVNQKPVFGVLGSDSMFYAPVLGFFAFTGIPTSAFLWYKSVQVANEKAEEQDRRDGYL